MSHTSSGSGYWDAPGAARSGGDDPDRTALRSSSPRRAAPDQSEAAGPRDGAAGWADHAADDTRPPPWAGPRPPRRAIPAVPSAGGEDILVGPRPFEPAEIDRTTRRDETRPRADQGAGGAGIRQPADPWQRPTPNPLVNGAPPAPHPAGQPVPQHSPDEPDDSTLPSRIAPHGANTGGQQRTERRDKQPRPDKQPRTDTQQDKDRKRQQKEQRPTSAKVLGIVREIGVIVVGALIITTLLRSFVFQPFEVPSGSMENTLQINDKIIAQRVLDFRRGDIVVFSDSNKWLEDGSGNPRPGPVRKALEFVGLLPDSADEHLVKRVIGMPGDRVKCCDKLGRVSVNGYPLDEAGYLYADSGGRNKPAEKPFEVVVPADRIFVMGDHRANSGDSRCHLQDVSTAGGKAGGAAFIPVSDVVGSVALIASPFARFQRLATPQSFAGIPPPQQVPPAEPVIVQVSEGC